MGLEPRVIVDGRPSEGAHRRMGLPDHGWALLGWLGLVFGLVGGADLLLTWVPLDFGNAEWEFGSYTASLNNLPIVLLGFGLVSAAGRAGGSRWRLMVGAVAFGVIALSIVVGGLVYALDIPLALRSVPDGPVRLGLQKAIGKTTVQFVAYGVLTGALSVTAWRWVLGSRESRKATTGGTT